MVQKKGTGNGRDGRVTGVRSLVAMCTVRETRRRLMPAMRVRFDTLRRVGSSACHRGAPSRLNISVYTTANHVDDAIRRAETAAKRK